MQHSANHTQSATHLELENIDCDEPEEGSHVHRVESIYSIRQSIGVVWLFGGPKVDHREDGLWMRPPQLTFHEP